MAFSLLLYCNNRGKASHFIGNSIMGHWQDASGLKCFAMNVLSFSMSKSTKILCLKHILNVRSGMYIVQQNILSVYKS